MRWWKVPGGVVAAFVLALAGCGTDDGGDGAAADTSLEARQAEVAERGAEVMPFDLDATTHVFMTTDDGGLQEVTADDPDDVEQVARIRAHLAEEGEKFSRGDFSDPAAIHGHDMPGVAELTEGYASITVTYAELPDGASLTYTTDDPALVEAVHAWFDRQVMDHGAHATAG